MGSKWDIEKFTDSNDLEGEDDDGINPNQVC
jgi:hypothetical protein